MALTIGTQLGSHEITALLGKGGMGEVYRARDTKLKRNVAIKILPEEFSRDPERIARFHREAQAIAALNHANIAAIHELGESGTTKFLVLELVEGDKLAQRIQRGPLPVEEALNIARQIADALSAAHEKGIVHRDLKPANIKITPQGKVKLLDFGLARIFENESEDVNSSNSPTLVSRTGGGVILGTAAYMSPEQARGQKADKQSDVWAFGCVLYEMLTGHQTFRGQTVTDILSHIVKSEPDWSALPEPTPAFVRSLLRRCLQKERSRRLHDIRDARIEIEETLAGSTAGLELRATAGLQRDLIQGGRALPANLKFVARPAHLRRNRLHKTPSTTLPTTHGASYFTYILDCAADYPWSSAAADCGLIEDTLLDPH